MNDRNLGIKLEDALKEELKDAEFRQFYEEEGKRLREEAIDFMADKRHPAAAERWKDLMFEELKEEIAFHSQFFKK